jgi:hypothetical protein
MRFTVGRFTWTAGRLELLMVGTFISGIDFIALGPGC